MQTTIKALVKKPGKEPYETFIDNQSLEDFCKLMGAQYIEFYLINREKKIGCLIDEEGKLKYLDDNFKTPRDIVCGTSIFVSDGGEDFKSLNQSQIRWIKKYLKENSL